MRKVRWEISSNLKTGKDLKEYDKTTYECSDEDIWLTTEVPMTKNTKSNNHKNSNK